MNLRTRIETLVLPFAQRPMRYAGGETNSIVKPAESVVLKGVLCFPDLYDIGMSHHGSQILYHIVNRNPRWSLARAFHPWTDVEEIMRRENIPLWDLEYLDPIQQADWVGFTVQYELQYTNILNMLDLAGIPLHAADRLDRGGQIIIGGGPCMVNPEPIAPFFDVLVIGDGERAIEQICETLERSKKIGWPRGAVLETLGKIDGVYVPSLVETARRGRFVCALPGSNRIRAARIASLSSNDYPTAPVVPLTEIVHNRLGVEIMRGCTRGCRFCAAGMYYRPVRERDSADLKHQIREGLTRTGFRDVGLLSLSTADYSMLDSLLVEVEQIREETRAKISLPSTRLDALTDAQLAAINAVVGASSFTLAPEAGSERLRSVINKGFSDTVIVDAVDRLARHGIQTIKLYFMVGLPTETDGDIDALINLVGKIAERARVTRGRIKINVAISPFSPKPQTPFQWEPMESPAALDGKGRRIKRELSHLKNVKVRYRDARVTQLETVLARGDRTVAGLIESVWRGGGRLESWDEYFDLSRWETAVAAVGVNFETFTDAIATTEPLPWWVCAIGVTTEYLLRERELAAKGVQTADCRTGDCSSCGVCTGIEPRLAAGADTAVVAPVKPTPARIEAKAAKGFWFRIVYRKSGRTRFLGHRDMTGVLQRALIAAGVRIVYSRGFSPHPRLAFGPPLPLGVGGEREGFDIQIEDERLGLDPANGLLPDGLELLEAKPMTEKPRSISDAMKAGMYRFSPLDALDETLVAEAIARFSGSKTVFVNREKKGGVKTVDIRPLVVDARWENHGGLCIYATLSMSPGATCSPAMFIGALDSSFALNRFHAVRTACMLADQSTAAAL